MMGRDVMRHAETQLAQFLLARITWQLERISEKQHWLARRKVLLQEQATRLRLGESPELVRMEIRRPITGPGETRTRQLTQMSGMSDAGGVFTG